MERKWKKKDLQSNVQRMEAKNEATQTTIGEFREDIYCQCHIQTSYTFCYISFRVGWTEIGMGSINK